MDSLDLQIIKMLGEDGRLSNHLLAERLGVSEPTVRNRVKQLLDNGTIRIRAQVNTDIFPDMLIAFVGIKQRGNPRDCIKRISQIPEVLYVANVTGSHDQIAVIAASSREMLAEIMTEKISAANIPNLVESETYIVLFNENMWLAADTIIDVLNARKDEPSPEKKC